MRPAALVLALVLGLAACSAPPAAVAPAADIRAQALGAFERSDWGTAARLLREAIGKEPTSLTLHYYLAIAAAHLSLREEAVREFQWVVAHAPAGSAELEAARTWLTDAGVFPAPAPAAPATRAEAAPPAAPPATLSGRVAWPEGQPPVPTARLQLFLKGVPGPTEGEYKVLRTDDTGGFQFSNVVPGVYKLTNRVAGQPDWRLRVQLEPGQSLTLDLTPANSTRARDDFPKDN